MLRKAFNTVYTKFKLHFYKEIFDRFQTCLLYTSPSPRD